MKDYVNKTKIGGYIALGGEHLIRQYGDDCVAKIPFGLRYFLRPRQYVGRIEDDYGLLRKYFGDYFLETKVYVNEAKDQYVLVQRKYHGRILAKRDVEADPEIRSQFLDIVARNRAMVKELDITWEFFGAWELLFSDGTRISNIIVGDDNRLKMFDTGLIYLNNKANTHWLIRFIVRWAMRKQAKLLDSLIGQTDAQPVWQK